MKKRNILVLFLMIVFLVACSNNEVNQEYQYDDSNYSFGNISFNNEGITKVTIDWLVGNIIVTKSDNNELIVREEKDTVLNDDYKFRYLLQNDTLDVKFTKSFSNLQYDFKMKNLYLFVPSYVQEIEMNIHNAEVKCDNINLEILNINGVNADVSLSKTNVKKLNIITESKDILLFNNEFEDVLIKTKQASIGLSVNDTIKTIDVITDNGDISLYVNTDYQFAIQFDTLSGQLVTKKEYTQINNRYVFNGEKVTFNVKTNSGNLKIQNK